MMREKGTKIDWDNLEPFRKRVQELKAQGFNMRQIREELNIRGNHTFYKLLHEIGEVESQAPKILPGKKRKPYTKREKPFPVSYQILPVEEKKEEKSDRPIFCLVVGFDSKEAAFKAMGQL